jgi:hypothetical protein
MELLENVCVNDDEEIRKKENNQKVYIVCRVEDSQDVSNPRILMPCCC